MKLRALLMCRSQQSLRLLARALDELGIVQDCCLSAQEAIELLAKGNYSALVLDFDLPGSTQVAKLARLAPAHNRPVVFAMIGASTDIPGTYHAGANFVLYKPLELEQISRSLRAARGFMGKDRRCSARHKVETVVYLLFGKSLAIPALMLDLNEDGLSVQAADPLPAMEKVPVYFLLPGGARAIEGTAEIIWADDSGRAGIFFSHLSPATRRRLRSWLSRRNKKLATRATRSSRAELTLPALQS
ncbi:MAG TPA: PilZ domain-containing protein [Terriglobales bacterium]|nr:PilZ domain-containing protein [Terriglobales bacterium]